MAHAQAYNFGSSWVSNGSGWDLYVSGIKIASIDNNGTLQLKGDIQTNIL